MLVINKIKTELNVANWLAPQQRRQKKGLVDGQNSYPPTIRKRMDLHLFHHGFRRSRVRAAGRPSEMRAAVAPVHLVKPLVWVCRVELRI
jgi:hypothetical protein